MADFQTSTHRTKWIFTPQELVEEYKADNQRAIQTLEKALQESLLFNCTHVQSNTSLILKENGCNKRNYDARLL